MPEAALITTTALEIIAQAIKHIGYQPVDLTKSR